VQRDAVLWQLEVEKVGAHGYRCHTMFRLRERIGSPDLLSDESCRFRGCMLTYAVIIGMALAGFLGGPWWLALAGAAALTLGAWWVKLLPPGREPRVAWTSKTRTYFVTGVALDIALATLCFSAGRLARALLAV
jgi:hypothetical protein